MPSVLSVAIQRRRMAPVLAFGPDAAVVWVPRVNAGTLELVEAARIPLAGDPAAVVQAGRTAIQEVARRLHGRAASAIKLRVALPAEQVLRKRFVLPAAVEENLRQAIAWDLDRLTPFPVEQLYFDAVVVARDPLKKEIRVDWAAALRTHVDQALRHAQSWGALVVGATPEAPVVGQPPAVPASRLNLLPEGARPDAAPWRHWQVLLPLVVVACAIAAAVVLPIWQKRESVLELLKDNGQARVQAAAADALRTEFERMTGDYNFVLARKYGYPAAVQLVEDVSRLLPDDTWLLQFELKTATRGKEPLHEIVLRGESGSAGRLVALLEESNLVEQATPRSPMTKIQPGPGEIFDLGARLRPLPLPAAVELVVSSGGPEAAAAASGTPPAGAASASAAAAATPSATVVAPAPSAPRGSTPATPTATAPTPPTPTAAAPTPATPTATAPTPTTPTATAPTPATPAAPAAAAAGVSAAPPVAAPAPAESGPPHPASMYGGTGQ